MAEEPRQEDSTVPALEAEGRHPNVGYEPRDVRFRFVLITILVAICIGVAQFYWIWQWFRDAEDQRAASISTDRLVAQPGMKLPPEPRLEQLDRIAGIETPDIRHQDAPKEQQLATYGITDEPGYIHIPIDRAMELVIDQLPVRKQSAELDAIKDRGLLDSGESNAGRMFREASR